MSHSVPTSVDKFKLRREEETARRKHHRLLALEDDVFQRSLSAAGPHSAADHLLRDLAATADLPPHCPLFSQRLLDLTLRWWSESEGPDIEEGDVYSLAAAACIGIKLHSARYRDRAPFQLP